jgi:hypothetical protein
MKGLGKKKTIGMQRIRETRRNAQNGLSGGVGVKERGESLSDDRRECAISPGPRQSGLRGQTTGVRLPEPIPQRRYRRCQDHRDQGPKPAGGNHLGHHRGYRWGRDYKGDHQGPNQQGDYPLEAHSSAQTYMNDICWTEQSRAAIRQCSSPTRDIAKYGEAQNRRYTTQEATGPSIGRYLASYHSRRPSGLVSVFFLFL